MTDENSRDRILKAVKDRVRESSERDRVRLIANIIGDRRERDLVDIIAQIEQDEGWNTALECLLKAFDMNYTSPMTLGKSVSHLEKLKYREVVFSLLACSGLEPVSEETIILLKELESEESLVDASRTLLNKLENLVVDQIKDGDTLFFDFSSNTSVSKDTIDLLQSSRSKNIKSISIQQDVSITNVDALWYREYGRIALTNLGVKGFQIDTDTLNSVLSVIQESPTIASSSSAKENVSIPPSNKDFQNLLSHIIHQDIDGLVHQASKHAIPTLSILLDEASSAYKDTPSTEGFKKILQCINSHIAVRFVDSVIALEKTSYMKDSRIATTAILAIGNYYHESAASALVDILCTKKNSEIIKTSIQSIENLYKKCPEADYVISSRLDRECINHSKLAKLLRVLRKERGMYY